ncbi:MAG TPA: hypothetical protein VG347_23110 [Verrucomicrobiae bacterium]|nr:hypothetical protein [Verrucomicrobiae bacterium]
MEIKFNCSNPACRQRISVDGTLAGGMVQCPVCKKELAVPKSNSIRFTCTNAECGQHMVVDVSEAGRFVRCPSCEKPLQVPGAPPKPLASKTAEKASADSASNKARTPREMPQYVRGLLLTALVLAVMTGWRLIVIETRPAHLKEIATELSSIGEFRSRPMPNYAGDKIVFLQGTEDGVGLFLFNITGGQKQLVHEQLQKNYSVTKFRPLGWSPDDRQFAYLDGSLGGQTQIITCDASGKQTGNVVVLGGLQDFTWLSPQALACLSWQNRDLLIFGQKPDGAWGRTRLFKELGTKNAFEHDLTATSYHSVIWLENDKLQSFDLASNAPVTLWQATSNALEHVSYSEETSQFLLVCGDQNGDSLFKLELPGGFSAGSFSSLGRVSSRSKSVVYGFCLNGDKEIAWLQRDLGQGTVFIKTNAAAEPVPVFARGSVYGFARSRNQLFITDCPAGTSPGIWACDPASLSSNLVFSTQQRNLKHAKNIASMTGVITNTSGKRITYHLWPSPQYLNGQKSVLLLGQTPYTWSAWEEVAANCGACVVSIDRPEFHSEELNDWGADVLDVYHALAKDPGIDAGSVYLYGRSAETHEMTALLENGADQWKGAIYFNPVSFPENGLLKLQRSRMMIDSGADDDNNHEMIPKFLQRAAEAGVPTMLVLHKDAGHTYHSAITEREQAEAVVKFLFGL